jgi:hypothetical protein
MFELRRRYLCRCLLSSLISSWTFGLFLLMCFRFPRGHFIVICYRYCDIWLSPEKEEIKWIE